MDSGCGSCPAVMLYLVDMILTKVLRARNTLATGLVPCKCDFGWHIHHMMSIMITSCINELSLTIWKIYTEDWGEICTNNPTYSQDYTLFFIQLENWYYMYPVYVLLCSHITICIQFICCTMVYGHSTTYCQAILYNCKVWYYCNFKMWCHCDVIMNYTIVWRAFHTILSCLSSITERWNDTKCLVKVWSIFHIILSCLSSISSKRDAVRNYT